MTWCGDLGGSGADSLMQSVCPARGKTGKRSDGSIDPLSSSVAIGLIN